MKFGALFGWGIVIYAVMFLLWSALVVYGYAEGVLPRLISMLALVATATVAGRSLRALTWKDVLPYSICWTLVVIGLDMILSVPFTGWSLFSDWNVWVGYGLVMTVPLLAPYLKRPTHASI